MAGAALQLHQLRDGADTGAALSAVPRFSIRENALTLKDYQAIQKKTPVFGSVQVAPAAGSVSVNASALSDYAAWRLTLDQVMLDNPGVTWQVETLCSGHCPGGESHQAVLKGTRLFGKVEQRSDVNAPPNANANARGNVSSSGVVSR
jgi:hypothetical protein